MKIRVRIPLKTILKIEAQIRREEYIEERAYDGRLAPRVIPDKKKQQNKEACRNRDYE